MLGEDAELRASQCVKTRGGGQECARGEVSKNRALGLLGEGRPLWLELGGWQGEGRIWRWNQAQA